MKIYASFAAVLLPMLTAMAAPNPLVYLPFDRRTIVAVGRIDTDSPLPGQPAQPAPGVRDECLMIDTDLRLSSRNGFNPAEGTISFWIRPAWDQQGIARQHMLFSLYGGEAPTWVRNRWSIWANPERVSATVYPNKGQQGITLDAPWGTANGPWRHVAWTWRNVNSGKPNAELILLLDGQPVARESGLQIDVGEIGPVIDIGRDSDGSPDYANADYDELYIYGIALPPEAILAAVETQRTPVAKQSTPTPVSPLSPSWPDPQRMCRFGATAQLPAGPPGNVTVRIPLDIQNDISQIGLHAAPHPDTEEVAGLAVIPPEM